MATSPQSMTREEYRGRAAYLAFQEVVTAPVAGLAALPVVPWEQLPEGSREAWRAAAAAVDDQAARADERDARRAALIAGHGAATKVDGATALRLIGKRDEVHPSDVAAFRYRDRAAAEAYAASNLEHEGLPTLGYVLRDDGGAIGVLDLRPYGSGKATDPALPDRPRG